MCVRNICVKAEKKNAKQSNVAQWIVYHQRTPNFLEEGRFIVGDASVACIVSQHYPIFMVFGIM